MLASRGHVTYVDHGTPWSIVAPDMRVQLFRRDARGDYGGTASFDGATVQIQTYEPFSARMQSRFSMQAPNLHFDRIDLLTDGAVSVLEGDLQMNNWPEQLYRIKSNIDIATQKDIFFHGQPFDATGDATFEGTFHYFKGGRELKGGWRSPVAFVTIAGNRWRFPNLRGDVLWVPDRLEVTDARADLYGGAAQFDYRLLSLDQQSGPRRAVWDARYQQVDLVQLTDFLETGRDPSGGAGQRREPSGMAARRMGPSRRAGGGHDPGAAGVTVLPKEPGAAMIEAQAALPEEAGPFNPRRPLGYVPVAGRLEYQLDPEWITLARSWVSTPKTYVEFDGRTAWLERSRIPFHVTSLDWQQADRVFAGILTAFGSPTVGGADRRHGEFDGVMLGAFNDPRIEGRFSGERMRAWDVVWGTATADVVIEDSYAHVSRSSLVSGDSEINAAGTFSLGYPRRDGGEEIDAHVTLRRRPMADLRHAFELDDWPDRGLRVGRVSPDGALRNARSARARSSSTRGWPTGRRSTGRPPI